MKLQHVTTIAISLALALVTAGVPSVSADEARSETAPYTANMLNMCAGANILPNLVGFGYTAWSYGVFFFGTLWPALPPVEAPQLNQDLSACYQVLPGETLVHLTFEDAFAPVVPYHFAFRDPSGATLQSGIACSDSANPFAIPDGSAVLDLTVVSHGGPFNCPDATGTSGWVTATFS